MHNRCHTRVYPVLRTCLVFTAAVFAGLLCPSAPLHAADYNATALKGNVQEVSWTEDVLFSGHAVRYDFRVLVWSYDPHPQLHTFGCLGSAGNTCLSPQLMGSCQQAPLDIQQMNPPAAYPVRVTRRCTGTAPGQGACVNLYGYYNTSSVQMETDSGSDITLVTGCSAK